MFGSILPWSQAHHERNWFVYRLRGNRSRIEGDLLRSQQFYESALREADCLKSKEKTQAIKNDLLELSKLRQRRLQAAAQPERQNVESDDEDSLDVKTNPREITFEWDSYQNVRSRLSARNSKKTKNSIFSILLTKENSAAGSDPIRLNELGDCNMMIGHFAEAQGIFARALEANLEGSEGDSDSLLLATLDRLSFSQWALQQFEAALSTSAKALALSQKYAPEKYTEILKLHRVQILLQCDRFDEGEKLCLEVAKNPHDLKIESNWYPLLLLGQCQTAKRKYGSAIESLEASLKNLEKNAPPYDMKVHRVCLALGEAYALSKNEEQAKKVYARAIDVYCRNGGTRRTNLDTLMARQGHAYSSINKYDIAAFCYKWAAQLREEIYGKEHYKVGVMLNNYAMALDHVGETAQANAVRARAQTMQGGREESARADKD